MQYPELVSIAAAAKALDASNVRPLAEEAAALGAAFRVTSAYLDAPGPQDDARSFPGWCAVFVTTSFVATKLVAAGKFALDADALAAARLANATTDAPPPVVVDSVFTSMSLVDVAGLADLP